MSRPVRDYRCDVALYLARSRMPAGMWGGPQLNLWEVPPMLDRKFSSLHVVAAFLWSGGLVTVLFCAHHHFDGYWLIGGFAAAVGMLINIKAMLLHLEDRERRAFELGRQVERGRLESVD